MEAPSSMKNFSIFETARELCDSTQTVDLGQISSISRKDFDERETFYFSSGTPALEYGCLLIENALLLRTSRKGRIYAGFEKLSLLQPIITRYLRIADLSESVFIFGEADWNPPRHPNIRIIPLKSDFKLAHESFLISHSPTLEVALIAKSEATAKADLREKRILRTIKTSSSNAVTQLATAAEGVIDWSIAG